jgi:hypothetical protein
MSERVPAALEAAIRSDLQPVRRLPSPLLRTAWLVPLALVTLVAASRMFSFRMDAAVLGWTMTWAISAAQIVLALMLIGLALRDAIPGRSLATPIVLLVSVVALGVSAAITLRTWSVSPTTIEYLSPVWVGEICFTGTVVSALPLLVAAAVLARRAFTVRPWSSGALYGLGAGIGADAGWRLFCHFSDPAHVFPTHTGAVIVTMGLGMIVAVVAQRLSAARPARTR